MLQSDQTISSTLPIPASSYNWSTPWPTPGSRITRYFLIDHVILYGLGSEQVLSSLDDSVHMSLASPNGA